MQTGDTITAIASPPADTAARGLIRLSGPSAFEILQTILAPKDRRDLKFQRAITTTTLRLEPPTTRKNDPSVTLRCIVALYPAPQSYTAEDSVEIITVGNRHLLHRILQLFLASGARAADPGEFTARAYFNGRLTLAQAEGIAATITAASEAQLRAAQFLTEGTLGKICHSLSERLTNALALVEAGIDFVDQEDVVPISTGRLYQEINALRKAIDELTEHAVTMAQLSAIPRVVIVGPPNAGKSTLFNALLKRQRAIVSSVSGTTRDALVEPLPLHPTDPHSPEVLLIDLAGLDPNDTGFFNPKMQAAAQEAIATADLIIDLHPADQRSNQFTPRGWAAELPMIQVRSKCDLISSGSEIPNETGAEFTYDLEISLDDKCGIDKLRTLIRDRLQAHTAILSADAIALEPRQRGALADARAHLAALADDLRNQAETQPDSFIIDSEFIAARLQLPLAALSRITGNQVTPDEVLGQIFAGFCVGK